MINSTWSRLKTRLRRNHYDYRVDKRKTYDEIIPYHTKTENDDSLEKGKTRVVQQGKEGKKFKPLKSRIKTVKRFPVN